MEKPLNDQKMKQLKDLAGSASSPISLNDIRDELKNEPMLEMSSESHWYINDIQAQQIIDTPRTIIKEVDVFSDLSLPKSERIEHAGRILKLHKYRKALESIVMIGHVVTPDNVLKLLDVAIETARKALEDGRDTE